MCMHACMHVCMQKCFHGLLPIVSIRGISPTNIGNVWYFTFALFFSTAEERGPLSEENKRSRDDPIDFSRETRIASFHQQLEASSKFQALRSFWGGTDCSVTDIVRYLHAYWCSPRGRSRYIIAVQSVKLRWRFTLRFSQISLMTSSMNQWRQSR